MNYVYAMTKQSDAQSGLMAIMERAGVDGARIFLDVLSSNTRRPQWRLLKERIASGDVIYIKSLDSLGLTYREIWRSWRFITQKRGADVVVLDTPALDTRGLPVVAELTTQLLDFIATKKTLAQEAQKRGRPLCVIPKNFDPIARQFLNGEIRGSDAAAQLGMAEGTFSKYAKRLGEKKKNFQKKRELPDNFETVARQFMAGEITGEEAARLTGMKRTTFCDYARKVCERTGWIRSGRHYKKEPLTPEFIEQARKYCLGEITGAKAAAILGISPCRFRTKANAWFLETDGKE